MVFFIDLSQTSTITPEYLCSVKCPTLILHSKNDSAVPLDHAYHAHQNIPNSKLVVLNSWGHLIWLGKHAQRVNDEVVDFLESR